MLPILSRCAGILSVALALAGCGTVHHYVPPVPPPAGTFSCSLGLSWSSNRFAEPALQANIYGALGGRDLVGIGFNNFFLPSSLSYAHYIRLDERSYLNLQLHTSAVGPDPRLEADLGYGTRRGDLQHGVKIGVGYMGEPTLRTFGRMPPGRVYPTPFVLVPVAGYDFRYTGFALAVQTQPGLSRNFATEYRDLYPWSLTPPQRGGDSAVVLARDQVVSIRQIEGGGPWEDQEWLIRLADSSVIYLSRRPPGSYACLPCAPVMRTGRLGDRPSEYQLYTVSRQWIPMGGTLEGPVMELNMHAIERWYHETGVLRIVQETHLSPEMLEQTIPGRHDLSIGAGYVFGAD